jgi:sporulation related protein
MTQFQVLARRLALAAIVACVFAGALSGWPSVGEARKSKSGGQPAQPAQGPQPAQGGGGDDAAQKAAAAAEAKKAYDAGLKEYAAGRSQSAVDQLSTAIKAGVLSASEMAKALYTRGLAYKKENKPGQAISDLTSAIWLKNGLSDIEKKAALTERSEAYRMAGLEDTGSTPDRPAIGAPSPSASAAPASTVVANPAPGPNAGSAGLSAGAIAEAAKSSASDGGSSATITRPPADSSLQSAASSTASEGDSKTPASSGFFGWAQPAEASSNSGASNGSSGSSSFGQTVSNIPGNVTGFFSNMFGGGSSAPPQEPAAAPSAAVMTASTTPTSVVPETSSWDSSTVVATGAAQKSSKAQKVALAAEDKPKLVAATKGKYKIHIAALRSRAEAEALAQQLVAQHGADLSNHVPTVDEAVIGSMGTFYRVRVGGYASQDEPRGVCNKLRTSGLDCLVVTN